MDQSIPNESLPPTVTLVVPNPASLFRTRPLDLKSLVPKEPTSYHLVLKSVADELSNLITNAHGDPAFEAKIRRLEFVNCMYISWTREETHYLIDDGDAVCSQSRYAEEFQEIERIGEGGFGCVCKAMCRKCNKMVAVKKIPFKYSNRKVLKEILGEVRLQALIWHPNIVRYNKAWIEVSTTAGDNIQSDLTSSYSGDLPSSPSYTSESSTSTGTEPEESQKQLSNNTSCGKVWDPNACESSESLEQPNEEPISPNVTDSLSVASPDNISDLLCSMDVRGVLYIQMELCSKTLADWLALRDSLLARSPEYGERVNVEALYIFHDILKGVEYIHSEGFIHRDIKPKNIMFNLDGSLVKLGDFGLATPSHRQMSSNPCTSCSDHTKGVGTVQYAAPEQREQAYYNNKVDIYSLGIVLVELLCPFSTAHELCGALRNLRNGILPLELKKHSEDVQKTILAMCSSNPKKRPSAKELLSSPMVAELGSHRYFAVPGGKFRSLVSQLIESP